MPFDPVAWLADCQVLTLAARGAWQTIICRAWRPDARGTVTLDLDAWARLFGTALEDAERAIGEIERAGVAKVARAGSKVTITCPRVVRDWLDAEVHHHGRVSAGRAGAMRRWHPETPVRQREFSDWRSSVELITEVQAITQAGNAGIPEDFAKFVYQDWHSRDGCDGAGVRCRYLQHVAKRWSRERPDWEKGTHRSQKRPVQRQTEAERDTAKTGLNTVHKVKRL